MAKLRLLERGLVDAALGVDDLHLKVSGGKGKGKADDSEDVEMDVEDEVPDEKPEEFMARINLYVAIHLSRTKNSRDDYKSENAYQLRKEVIQEVLRNCILKKCQNGDCSSYVLPRPYLRDPRN